MASTSKLTPEAVARGKSKGFRSGLELRIAAELTEKNVSHTFETSKFKYTLPAKTYTVDFDLIKKDGTIMHIETKGWFKGADRTKHLNVRKSNPEADIRFVFERAKSPLTKGSKTSYADWCNKHGFKWAETSIPQEWLDEVA